MHLAIFYIPPAGNIRSNGLEYTFHGLECTFHGLEYRMELTVYKKQAR